MSRLPLTVIGGYLGAGKTTTLNRLLAEDHGLRLLVMVNDFGAINIDAALLRAAGEDSIELSNGCVCCTMGADLFLAIGDALDRRPRPDHLVIEASGVADPARIARAALAEPELGHGGTVVVVDGPGFGALAADPMIGAQIEAQLAAADCVLVAKAGARDMALEARLAGLSGAPVHDLATAGPLSPLLLGVSPMTRPAHSEVAPPHPAYRTWSVTDDTRLEAAALRRILSARPEGAFRIKGVVAAPSGGAWEVHGVGGTLDVKPAALGGPTRLVAIGLAERLSEAAMAAWWGAARA